MGQGVLQDIVRVWSKCNRLVDFPFIVICDTVGGHSEGGRGGIEDNRSDNGFIFAKAGRDIEQDFSSSLYAC